MERPLQVVPEVAVLWLAVVEQPRQIVPEAEQFASAKWMQAQLAWPGAAEELPSLGWWPDLYQETQNSGALL